MPKRKRALLDATVEHPASKHRGAVTRTLVVDVTTPVQHLALALRLLDERDAIKVVDVVGEHWPTRGWKVGVLDARGCQSFHLLHAEQVANNCGWLMLRGTKVLDQLSRRYRTRIRILVRAVLEGDLDTMHDQLAFFDQDPIFRRSDLDPFDLKDSEGRSVTEHAITFEDTALLEVLGARGVLNNERIAFELGTTGYMMLIESAVQDYLAPEHVPHVFYGALNREQTEVVDWFMFYRDDFLQHVDPARVLHELALTCFPFSSVAAIIPSDPSLATDALLRRILLCSEANFGLIRWCATVLNHEWSGPNLYDLVLDQHGWSEAKLTNRLMKLVGVGYPLNEDPDDHTLLHALANPHVSGDCLFELSKLVTVPENLRGNGRWDWLKGSEYPEGVKDALHALGAPLRHWTIAHPRHASIDLATYAFLRGWHSLTKWLAEEHKIQLHPSMIEALKDNK